MNLYVKLNVIGFVSIFRCLEEETRAAIVEILNVVDPVPSAFDYTNYMKVAKIDYKKLFALIDS